LFRAPIAQTNVAPAHLLAATLAVDMFMPQLGQATREDVDSFKEVVRVSVLGWRAINLETEKKCYVKDEVLMGVLGGDQNLPQNRKRLRI
jgi:hypothetical protein